MIVEDMRLQCLALAVQVPGNVLENANAFFDFVSGMQNPVAESTTSVSDVVVPKAEPAKRGPKPKAQEPAADLKTESPPTEDTNAIVYSDVQKAVLAAAQAKGRDFVIGVLKTFKVSNAKDLNEAQWANCIAALS